jgi:signal transduction histidine kinase
MSAPINILLVDDEQRNLDALEVILDDPAYRLLSARDANATLSVLLHHEVAAIVMDVQMPSLSGFELARLIKGTRRFREIPILFLTARLLQDQDVLAGYDAGAVDYLVKPVNPRILRQKVAIFADLFRKTRALAELNDHLELRVRERTDELRAANKQKDQFLATLAHELRNPLAPMRTGLDILLREPDPSANALRTLAALNRQLSHMVRLIDDLLDVSRISRGTLDMRLEDVDLCSVTERAVETVQPALMRHQQSAVLDVDAGLCASVDATRITQILTNLLDNASKFSPRGAVIRLALHRDGRHAVARVSDDGVGIPADQLERAFQMFTKVERSEAISNEGIGLALSRQLAHLHGGTLTATSEGEGRGATFTLSIPIGTPRSPVIELPADQHAERRATEPRAVVVIDDNEDAADLLAAWLERLGHRVHVARTGPDGVALVADPEPDLVLCDVGLPGMDGVEVCRHVVSGMSTPPVMVALTGWGAHEDRARTAAAGFQHHLVKPVAMDQLGEILRAVPARHRPTPL